MVDRMASEFEREVADNIAAIGAAKELIHESIEWVIKTAPYKYTYNFSWLGRPAIQLPTDAWAMQELIWHVKPDLIIETGIAHGGSLIFSASMLALLDICDAMESGKFIDPKVSARKVLGIDIDIREHNRAAIEAHPLSSRIMMIEGSSVAPDVIQSVHNEAKKYKRVLVCLDSNHTHEHVLAELNAYGALVSKDSYCVVFDTIVEDMPANAFPDRPWGIGDNPKTAVLEYLKNHSEFKIDKNIQNKLLITVAPDGYLRRIY